MRVCALSVLSGLMVAVVACQDGDGTGGVETGGRDTGGGAVDCSVPLDYGACPPHPDDYRAREAACVDDGWDACISDDGIYHRIEESISSIARVAAYDTIGTLLWDNPEIPGEEDFLEARILFEEEQGLGSRVARRYDVHYPAPDEGGCEDEGVPEANPDYCVGPAVLQPVIVDAFAEGILGNNPRVNAAKIEAALQWFLYVSPLKESTTCADTAKDCDSAWAYYSGGTPRETPAGLARDIQGVAPATHDRAYDAVLGVRCWRDIDGGETALDLELRDVAVAQLDRALLHGMSRLIIKRLEDLQTGNTDSADAIIAALGILVPLFDRAMRERDPEAADLVAGELEKEILEINIDAVIAAIDLTFPCP